MSSCAVAARAIITCSTLDCASCALREVYVRQLGSEFAVQKLDMQIEFGKSVRTISFNKTLPSFVSLICSSCQGLFGDKRSTERTPPAPSTSLHVVSIVISGASKQSYIFRVPRGPRLDARTCVYISMITAHARKIRIPSAGPHRRRCSPGELPRASVWLLATVQCLQTARGLPSTRPLGSVVVRPTCCKVSIRVSNNTRKKAR